MKILNKKAKFNYVIKETFEAGMVLTGSEVKAVKQGRVDISRSYAKVMGNEMYLVNANVSPLPGGDFNPIRTRKLLLHKKQIIEIKTKVQGKSLTLVPTKLYTKGRLIKAEIALAKPKKRFEKRESLKKADIKREIERELKNY